MKNIALTERCVNSEFPFGNFELGRYRTQIGKQAAYRAIRAAAPDYPRVLFGALVRVCHSNFNPITHKSGKKPGRSMCSYPAMCLRRLLV